MYKSEKIETRLIKIKTLLHIKKKKKIEYLSIFVVAF